MSHENSSGWLRLITNCLLFLCFGMISATPLYAWHRSVTLRNTSNQRFVVAENGGGGIVNVNRTRDREWETFTLLDLNEGDLLDGERVAFRTMDGHFLTAEGAGGREVVANRTNPAAWETFIIHKVPLRPGEQITGFETISLTTEDGRFYVTARDFKLFADRAFYTGTVLDSEKFVISQQVADPAPLKLSAPFMTPHLFAPSAVGVDQRATPSSDTFTCTNSFFGPNFPNCYAGHRGTDFPLVGGFSTMDAGGGVFVVAAAPGKVVDTVDGNNDRCYAVPNVSPPFPPPQSFSWPPPFPPEPAFGTRIICPGVRDSDDKLHNLVVVLQDDGLLAYYLHLKRGSVAVMRGQRVACGQLLGKVGSAGDSSMPHLHFELSRVTSNFPKDSANPGNANDYFNESGNRRPGRPVDPYSPILWANLPLRIPAPTCFHSSTNRLLGESCGVSEACNANFKCVNGACRNTGLLAGAPCDANNLCDANLTCTGGRCALPAPSTHGLGGSCSLTQLCEFGLACVNNVCKRIGIPLGGSCDSNQICAPGLDCRDGKCATPPIPEVGLGARCDSGHRCKSGLSCRQGRCVP
jgi:murein DD-endopeptidase MepM/ murein hydrolase activator NlpD